MAILQTQLLPSVRQFERLELVSVRSIRIFPTHACFAFFTFAHLALCAAAILRLACNDIVRFPGAAFERVPRKALTVALFVFAHLAF
jgi:hypothetical protein